MCFCLICNFNVHNCLKAKLHMSQMYGLSLELRSDKCFCRWVSKWNIVLYVLSHSSHLYGRFEWWMLFAWLLNARWFENVSRHSVHLNAVACCCFLWICNEVKFLNESKQMMHWCVLLWIWMSMCCFSLWNFRKFFAQMSHSYVLNSVCDDWWFVCVVEVCLIRRAVFCCFGTSLPIKWSWNWFSLAMGSRIFDGLLGSWVTRTVRVVSVALNL